MDSRGHNFGEVPRVVQLKYGLMMNDQMCLNCGIVINHMDCIVIKNKNGNYRDSLDKIIDYELNCAEIMIKSLLE
jgi:hypothetical protein